MALALGALQDAWQVFLPGESPWTEEPGGLQSMGLQRDTTERLSTAQGSKHSPLCGAFLAPPPEFSLQQLIPDASWGFFLN